MLYNKLSLLAAAPLLALAQAQTGSSQFNAAFFPTADEATCQEGDLDAALVFSTTDVPRAFTCFNLTDLFSGRRDSGFQNDSKADSPDVGQDDDSAPPKGVEWELWNRDAFDAGTNYTNVWFRQQNLTGDAEEGGAGRWVFYTYAFEDCEQVGGDDFEPDEYPWFESSCQTAKEGSCQTLPQTVKSFALGPADNYNEMHGGCEAWAEMGAAPQLAPRGPAVAALAAGIAAYFLVL